MPPEPGLGYARLLLHEQGLPDGLVHQCRVPKAATVFRHERSAHVEAIQPHLSSRPLLVPEAAFVVFGVEPQLSGQLIQGIPVSGIPGSLLQGEKQNARLNVVKADLVLVEYVSALVDIGIHPFLQIGHVVLTAIEQKCLVNARQEDPLVIMEVITGWQIASFGEFTPHGVHGRLGVLRW